MKFTVTTFDEIVPEIVYKIILDTKEHIQSIANMHKEKPP